MADIEFGDDVEIADAEISDRDCTAASLVRADLARCRFTGVRFAGASFEHARLVDVEFVRCDLAGADFSEASGVRVRCDRLPVRGRRAPAGPAASVRVRRLRGSTTANFRMARLEDVRFDACSLVTTDLTAAQLTRVVFSGSNCAATDFTNVRCEDVDLRGARLEGIRGVGSLRGATIGRDHLVPLALDLAIASGLLVRDEEPTEREQ